MADAAWVIAVSYDYDCFNIFRQEDLIEWIVVTIIIIRKILFYISRKLGKSLLYIGSGIAK